MRDKLFNILLWISGLSILAITIGLGFSLVLQSIPAISQFGFFDFFTSSTWDPREDKESFGALPFIAGSLLTALLALIIATPFSLAVITLTNYITKKRFVKMIDRIIDAASTIPPIVWGIWGYYTIRPTLDYLNIGDKGFGIICTSIVLAIMIIPFTVSYSSIYIRKIPNHFIEGAYALGATRTEVTWKIKYPYVWKSLVSAHILGFSKALGETMIAVILIGNSNMIPSGLSDTGNTMTSILLTQSTTGSTLKQSALFAIALALFAITACINLSVRRLIRKMP